MSLREEQLHAVILAIVVISVMPAVVENDS